MKKDIEKYINNSIKAETPPSLSKENIEKMLDCSTENPRLSKRKRVQTVYKFAALAAAFALVLGAVSLYSGLKKPKSIPFDSDGVLTVSSDENYDEIYARLKAMKASIDSGYKFGNINSGNKFNEAKPGGALDNGNKDTATEEAVNSGNRDFGTTNTQEENVDEGDIIKTDGKNIYLADRNNNCVYVVKADGGRMSKLSEISFSGNVHIQEMYLNGSVLAVVYSEYDYAKQPLSYNGEVTFDTVFRGGCCAVWAYSDTKISFYDISNPENITLISDYSQSGEFTSSRLVDGKLYLVSSYCVDLFARDYKDTCIPETSQNGKKERIPASKITLVNGTETPSYAVICTFDVQNAKKTDSSAIFGNPTNVYATENSFYLVEERYDSEKCSPFLNILKFEFTETGVKYLASAKAEGRLNSNLSMSEHKGFFRVATTCENIEGDNENRSFSLINKLYIFDSELKQTGLVDGFAKYEEIRSARYVGDYAYVVTSERTDPLFVINLSDPKDPKIEGELKLPGFSSYLHPVGGGLLVGVGKDGDENNANGNMKVSLFSVSDPKKPKELSSVKIGDKNDYIESDVSYSYKAFVNLPDGEFAVPISSDYSRNLMFIRYCVADGAVTEIARYKLLGGTASEIIGGTYIGNYFYVFSSEFIDGETSEKTKWNARLTSFDMTSNAKTQEIAL